MIKERCTAHGIRFTATRNGELVNWGRGERLREEYMILISA